MKNMAYEAYEACDICGRPVYDGQPTCRHCIKQQEARRRMIRLVKERRKNGGWKNGRI